MYSAPVLYVEGRQYKVKIMYAAEPQDDYCEAALKCIFDVHLRRPPGDILVFLPGKYFVTHFTASKYQLTRFVFLFFSSNQFSRSRRY